MDRIGRGEVTKHGAIILIKVKGCEFYWWLCRDEAIRTVEIGREVFFLADTSGEVAVFYDASFNFVGIAEASNVYPARRFADLTQV